jgi:hypothetical protein
MCRTRFCQYQVSSGVTGSVQMYMYMYMYICSYAYSNTLMYMYMYILISWWDQTVVLNGLPF